MSLPQEEDSDREALWLTCAEHRMNSPHYDLFRPKEVVQKNLARHTDSCGG
jgi:hypothetical protein